jgi:hypothetical protein
MQAFYSIEASGFMYQLSGLRSCGGPAVSGPSQNFVSLYPKDLSAFDLHRYLRQWALGWTGHDLGAVSGIENGAVARAGELPLLIGYYAALVGADSRVGHEVPTL